MKHYGHLYNWGKHMGYSRTVCRFLGQLRRDYDTHLYEIPQKVYSYLTRKNVTLFWVIWEIIESRNEAQRDVNNTPMLKGIEEFSCYQLHDDGTTTKIF